MPNTEMHLRRIEYGVFFVVGFILPFIFLDPENQVADHNVSSILSNESDDRQAADPEKLYKYPAPILLYDLSNVSRYYRYGEGKSYNWGVLGFEVSPFMSYAAHFCKHEAEDGAIEIVSVGSGDGTIEKDIIGMHEKLFGTKPNITLVDNDPEFVNIDFRTVDDLIESRPTVVDNCVLLLIWPEAEEKQNDYDIEAVRKLQPLFVLTLYETRHRESGSVDFKRWIESCAPKNYSDEYVDTKHPKLKKYTIEECVDQPVVNSCPDSFTLDGITFEKGSREPVLGLRMMRLKKYG